MKEKSLVDEAIAMALRDVASIVDPLEQIAARHFREAQSRALRVSEEATECRKRLSALEDQLKKEVGAQEALLAVLREGASARLDRKAAEEAEVLAEEQQRESEREREEAEREEAEALPLA